MFFRKRAKTTPCPNIKRKGVNDSDYCEPPRKVLKFDNPDLQCIANAVIADISSGDQRRESKAIDEIRHMDCSKWLELLNRLVAAGLISKLTEFLNPDWSIETALRATQALANVTFFLKYDQLVQADVVPALIKLIHSPNTSVAEEESSITTAAMHVIGYLAMGDNVYTNYIIAEGVCTTLNSLLYHSDPEVIEAAAWVVSAIAEDNYQHINSLFVAGVPTALAFVLSTSENFRCRREAAVSIYNITKCASFPQLDMLIQTSMVKPMCRFLACQDYQVNLIILETLDHILMGTSVPESVFLEIYACGSFDRIKALGNGFNGKVSSFANSIITQCSNFLNK